MMTLEDKKKTLNKALANLKKKDNLSLDFGNVEEMEFFETPFPTLNTLIGGGFPKGKFTTIAGAERTAKGTLILQTIGYHMQKDPEFIVLWTDAEDAMDREWAEMHGVDFDRVIVQKYSDDAPYFEKLLDAGLKLIETGSIDMWVLDSVGAFTPKSEYEKDIEENAMLDLQRKLGLFFRKSIRPVSVHKVGVIMVGQIYEAPQTSYVDIRVKGGNALKHWAHLRLMTRRGNRQEGPTAVKVMAPDGETRDIVPGWAQHIKVDKTRVNDKEGQEIILQFVFGRGLDSIAASITALLAHGIVERRGAYYYNEKLPDGKIQGKDALIDLLKADEALRSELITELDTMLAQEHIQEEKQPTDLLEDSSQPFLSN